MARLSSGIGGAFLGSTLQNTLDTLPVVYSQDIQGGLTTVVSNTDRNAIPVGKLQLGMLVYVSTDNRYYRFVQGSLNQATPTSPFDGTVGDANWVEVHFDTGVTVNSGDVDPLPRTGFTGNSPANPSEGDLYINHNDRSLWYFVAGSDNLWFSSQGLTVTAGDDRYVQYNEATSLTPAEQLQARNNIGAGNATDRYHLNTGEVVEYNRIVGTRTVTYEAAIDSLTQVTVGTGSDQVQINVTGANNDTTGSVVTFTAGLAGISTIPNGALIISHRVNTAAISISRVTATTSTTLTTETLSINVDGGRLTDNFPGTTGNIPNGEVIFFGILADEVEVLPVGISLFDNTRGYQGNDLVNFGGRIYRARNAQSTPTSPAVLANPDTDTTNWEDIVDTDLVAENAELENDVLTVSDRSGNEVFSVNNIANQEGSGVHFDNSVNFRSGGQFATSSGYTTNNINHNNPNAFTTQQDIYNAIQAEREANGLVTGEGLGNHRYAPAFGYELANTWTPRNTLSPYTLSLETAGRSSSSIRLFSTNGEYERVHYTSTGYQVGAEIQALGVSAGRSAVLSRIEFFGPEAIAGLISLIRAEEARTPGRIRSIRFLEGSTDRIEIHGIADTATAIRQDPDVFQDLLITTVGNTFTGTVGPFPITNIQVSRNLTGGNWVDIGLPEEYPQSARGDNVITFFVQEASGDNDEKFNIRSGDAITFATNQNFSFSVLRTATIGTGSSARTRRIAFETTTQLASLNSIVTRNTNINASLRRPYESMGNVITELAHATINSFEYLVITLSDTVANLGLETDQFIKIRTIYSGDLDILRAGIPGDSTSTNVIERIDLQPNQIAVRETVGTTVYATGDITSNPLELFRRIDFIDNNPAAAGDTNLSYRSYSLRPSLGDTLPDIGTNASRIQQALDDGNWVTLDNENVRAYNAGNVGSFQNNQLNLAVDIRQYNSSGTRINVDRGIVQPGDIIRFVNPGDASPSIPVIVTSVPEVASPWGVQSAGIFVRRLTNPGLTTSPARGTTLDWTGELALPSNTSDPNGRRIQVLRSNRYSISQEGLFLGHTNSANRDTLSVREHKLSIEAHKIYRSHDGNTWYFPYYALEKSVDNSLRLETGLGALSTYRANSFSVGTNGFTGYYIQDRLAGRSAISVGSQTLRMNDLSSFRYLNFRQIEEAAAIPHYGGVTQLGRSDRVPSQVYSGATVTLGNIDGTDFDVNGVQDRRTVSSYGPFEMLTNKRNITHVWTGYSQGATYPRIDYQLDDRPTSSQVTVNELTTDPFLPPGYRFIIHDRNNTTGVQNISFDEYLIADRVTSESLFPETSRFLSGSVDRINRPVRFNSGSGFNTTFEANIDGITRHARTQLAGSYELTLMRTSSFETNDNLFPRVKRLGSGISQVGNGGHIRLPFGPTAGRIRNLGTHGNITVALDNSNNPGVWRLTFSSTANATAFLSDVAISELNEGTRSLEITYGANTTTAISESATIYRSPVNDAWVLIADPGLVLPAQSTATALTGTYRYHAPVQVDLPTSTLRDYHYQIRFSYDGSNRIINFTDKNLLTTPSIYDLYEIDSSEVPGIVIPQGQSSFTNATVYQITHSEAEVQVPALLTAYNNGIDTRIRPGDLVDVDYSTPNTSADPGQSQVAFDITTYTPAEARLNIRNRDFNNVVVLGTTATSVNPGDIIQLGVGTDYEVTNTQAMLYVREGTTPVADITSANIQANITANPNDWTAVQIPTTITENMTFNTPGQLPGADENVLQFGHNVLANLNALSDVTLELNNTLIANDDILAYDSTDSVWTNQRASDVIQSQLSSAGNVDFSTVTSGVDEGRTQANINVADADLYTQGEIDDRVEDAIARIHTEGTTHRIASNLAENPNTGYNLDPVASATTLSLSGTPGITARDRTILRTVQDSGTAQPFISFDVPSHQQIDNIEVQATIQGNPDVFDPADPDAGGVMTDSFAYMNRIDGTNRVFRIDQDISQVTQINRVRINGVTTTAFTASIGSAETTITFTTAPAEGSTILIDYITNRNLNEGIVTTTGLGRIDNIYNVDALGVTLADDETLIEMEDGLPAAVVLGSTIVLNTGSDFSSVTSLILTVTRRGGGIPDDSFIVRRLTTEERTRFLANQQVMGSTNGTAQLRETEFLRFVDGPGNFITNTAGDVVTINLPVTFRATDQQLDRTVGGTDVLPLGTTYVLEITVGGTVYHKRGGIIGFGRTGAFIAFEPGRDPDGNITTGEWFPRTPDNPRSWTSAERTQRVYLYRDAPTDTKVFYHLTSSTAISNTDTQWAAGSYTINTSQIYNEANRLVEHSDVFQARWAFPIQNTFELGYFSNRISLAGRERFQPDRHAVSGLFVLNFNNETPQTDPEIFWRGYYRSDLTFPVFMIRQVDATVATLAANSGNPVTSWAGWDGNIDGTGNLTIAAAFPDNTIASQFVLLTTQQVDGSDVFPPGLYQRNEANDTWTAITFTANMLPAATTTNL